MKKLRLTKKEILEFQQNRDPYLFIDIATEVIPGVSSKAFKKLQEDEWFFKVHWKNDPNMPGMLQVEAIVQTCALAILSLPGNKGKVVYLISANNLKFKKKILPNDEISMETKVNSIKRGFAKCSGKLYVNHDLACSAEFDLILPDELNRFKINKK